MSLDTAKTDTGSTSGPENQGSAVQYVAVCLGCQVCTRDPLPPRLIGVFQSTEDANWAVWAARLGDDVTKGWRRQEHKELFQVSVAPNPRYDYGV